MKGLQVKKVRLEKSWFEINSCIRWNALFIFFFFFGFSFLIFFLWLQSFFDWAFVKISFQNLLIRFFLDWCSVALKLNFQLSLKPFAREGIIYTKGKQKNKKK